MRFQDAALLQELAEANIKLMGAEDRAKHTVGKPDVAESIGIARQSVQLAMMELLAGGEEAS